MAQDTKCARCGTGLEPENVKRHPVGPELKRLRTSSGVTQKTLAEILGLSQPYISQIESGKISIPYRIRDEYHAMFENWVVS